MPIITKDGIINDDQEEIIILANTASADDSYALYNNAPILGVDFPAYSDGRGFTLGKRLRILGFNGKLRAVGPLIPDQFLEALELGFDEIQISEEQLKRQPWEQWEKALKAYSAVYQNNPKSNDKIGRQSILAARWGQK